MAVQFRSIVPTAVACTGDNAVYNNYNVVGSNQFSPATSATPFPRNVIPKSLLDSTAIKTLPYIVPGSSYYLNSNCLIANTTGRIDHTISNSNRIYGRYSITAPAPEYDAKTGTNLDTVVCLPGITAGGVPAFGGMFPGSSVGGGHRVTLTGTTDEGDMKEDRARVDRGKAAIAHMNVISLKMVSAGSTAECHRMVLTLRLRSASQDYVERRE